MKLRQPSLFPKVALIQEIETIYEEFGYNRAGGSLEGYSDVQLQIHLENLKSGKLDWMRKRNPNGKSGYKSFVLPNIYKIRQRNLWELL